MREDRKRTQADPGSSANFIFGCLGDHYQFLKRQQHPRTRVAMFQRHQCISRGDENSALLSFDSHTPCRLASSSRLRPTCAVSPLVSSEQGPYLTQVEAAAWTMFMYDCGASRFLLVYPSSFVDRPQPVLTLEEEVGHLLVLRDNDLMCAHP